MLKIPKRVSIAISLILTVVMIGLTAFVAVLLPGIVDDLAGLRRMLDSYSVRLLVVLYVALVPAFAAEISLLVMLSRIGKGKVFDDTTVQILRLVSWCCFAECALFLLIASTFPLAIGNFPFSYVIAAAAVFVGMIVRVVKNVMEEAVAIKGENDFTI